MRPEDIEERPHDGGLPGAQVLVVVHDARPLAGRVDPDQHRRQGAPEHRAAPIVAYARCDAFAAVTAKSWGARPFLRLELLLQP